MIISFTQTLDRKEAWRQWREGGKKRGREGILRMK
jgi:hypothetical protein